MLFGQQKVMRRHLAGHAQPVAPRLAHGGQRGGGGDVRHMQVGARVAQFGDQADIALDDASIRPRSACRADPSLKAIGPAFMLAPCGHPRILGMLDHGQAHARRGGQRFAHDVVFENRMPSSVTATAPADLSAA